MGKLNNKVALITGAANGIGKSVSLMFATEGAKVVCADIMLDENEAIGNKLVIRSAKPVSVPRLYGETLGKVVNEIHMSGGIALGVQTDISDEESLDHLIYETRRVFGPVDILVNNAVLTYFYPILEMPTKFWERCFAVTVHATFMLSKKVLPSMMDRHGGAIININSMAAIGPGRGPYNKKTSYINDAVPMYGAAKAAVERFTQGLAAEVYQHGITVAAVAPSVTVKTAGGDYLGLKRPNWEPPDMMPKAVLLLATEPLDSVTGRVTYSQAILKEFGWIESGEGAGIDFPGSGYSQI